MDKDNRTALERDGKKGRWREGMGRRGVKCTSPSTNKGIHHLLLPLSLTHTRSLCAMAANKQQR